MRSISLKLSFGLLVVAMGLSIASHAQAQIKPGWDGKRHISYQQQKDLFYNYYAQPGPFNGAAAELYVSPRPVPPFVGHTWNTYQPFYPHEFMYRHQRAYYTYNQGGAGWRRTNVRYDPMCLRCVNNCMKLREPMSNNIWALHNDFYYPGVRW